MNPQKKPPKNNKKEEKKEDAVTEIIKKSQKLSRDWLDRDVGRSATEEEVPKKGEAEEKDSEKGIKVLV